MLRPRHESVRDDARNGRMLRGGKVVMEEVFEAGLHNGEGLQEKGGVRGGEAIMQNLEVDVRVEVVKKVLALIVFMGLLEKDEGNAEAM